MGNGWLAEVGTDPRRRAREIASAHSTFMSTRSLDDVRGGVRDVVVKSWLRSAEASAGDRSAPPVVYADGDLERYRSDHPLSRVIHVLRQLVGAVADDGDHLMAVTDAAGRLLWVEGHPTVRSRAERMGFIAGAWWDEAHAGTNAPGTALALDHEVQIFASEHFLPQVQKWSCSAAPIHDPATGRLLGAVDITGGDGVASPMSLGLVRAAARAAESELRAGLWVPRSGVRLSALGRDEAVLEIGGDPVRLHRRHSEMAVTLALHPDGLTGEQLADQLYDDLANPVTLRAEFTRLRRVIGELLESRPYRLNRPIECDFGDVAAALRAADLAGALSRYAGPLLPASQAPGVADHRRWLDIQLRAAVLTSSDPELVRRWADGGGFGDLQVWERLASIAPLISTHRIVAATRIQQLRVEYGLTRPATFMQRPGH